MKLRKFIFAGIGFAGILLNSSLESAVAASSPSKSYSKALKFSPSTPQKISENDICAMESRLIEMVNRERSKSGRKPLTNWKELSACARKHSQNMAEGKVGFGHKGFEQRAEAMRKIAQLLDFGENVGCCIGYNDPLEMILEGWMKSPGHKDNILSDYEQTGMGIAYSKDGRYFMTQLFAKRAQRRFRSQN